MSKAGTKLKKPKKKLAGARGGEHSTARMPPKYGIELADAKPAPITSMKFTGRTLAVEGEPPMHVSAVSGLMPHHHKNKDHLDKTGPDAQELKNEGPIPEGSYVIKPDEVQHQGMVKLPHGKSKPKFNPAFGPLRVQLHETTITKWSRQLTTDRDGGFFLHQDITRDGTAGCIGIQTSRDTHDVFARIEATESEIPVTVEYPKTSVELPFAPGGDTAFERVAGWLAQHKALIVAAEAKWRVDRRAIAGAIAWEALENVWSNILPGARFSGPGKVHYREHHFSEGTPVAKEVENRGMLPRRTQGQREHELADPAGAIEYIGAIMRAFADEARGAGYHLYRDPPLLTTFYNAWKLDAARRLFATKRYPEPLSENDRMGAWVHNHLADLERIVGTPPARLEPADVWHPAAAPKGKVQRFARSPDHHDPLERHAERIAARVAHEPSSRLARAVGRETGTVLDATRFHHDAEAGRRAGALDALAFTVGRDVYFGHGQYDPGSNDGRHLIAHELVHVAQQQAGAERVQKFEAPKHEGAGMSALTAAGFTTEEASDSYFGNWMRDMNQVFVPMIMEMAGGDAEFPAMLVSYLGAKKFGREFQLEDFGYYIPAEHLDSPAGLVGELDLLPKQPGVKKELRPPNTPSDPRGTWETPQQSVEPHAKVDKDQSAEIFSVDEGGMIAYLSRSLVHIERRLHLAIDRGRNPVGFMHLGAAMHAVEDLFAHSNWVEIVVAKMLAEEPTLLPELKGHDREIFNFAPDVTIGGATRPVLMTGSFTSLDTMMSIGSELVNILRKPYEPPATEAEFYTEQQMTYAGLRKFHERTAQHPEMLDAVRDIVAKHTKWTKVGPAIAHSSKWVLGQDLASGYRAVMEVSKVVPWETKLKIAKATARISEMIKLPIADALEAKALKGNVADTSLLENVETAKRIGKGQFSVGEKVKMALTWLFTLTPIPEQMAAMQSEQARRLPDLLATPDYVLAGPSHSMIAKDHANSPFFGLAFACANAADRLIADKVIEAWVEKHGADARSTTPLREKVHPPKSPEQKAAVAHFAKEQEEFRRYGASVLEHGGDPEQSYDLAAGREQSAAMVQHAASVLEALAESPEKAQKAFDALGGVIGKINRVWAREIAESFVVAGATVRTYGDAGARRAALVQLAADLTVHAKMVRRADTGEARETANDNLVSDRARAFDALVAEQHLADGTRAGVLYMLDLAIVQTQVAYRTRQITALRAAAAPKVEHVALPSVQNERPAMRALLETVRMIFSHPYQSAWWRPTVRTYLTKHADIARASIHARNARYVVFPPPKRGHEH